MCSSVVWRRTGAVVSSEMVFATRSLCWKSTWPSRGSTPLAACASACRVRRLRIHSCGVRVPQHSRSQASCLESFPSLDFQASELYSGDTSALCDHPDACSSNFGQSTSLEAIETTRLLHGFYVDESSACYV